MPSAEDKRTKQLSLTAEGERVAAQAEAVIIRLNEDLLGDLDPERRTMALEIMTSMLKRFNPDAFRIDEGPAA